MCSLGQAGLLPGSHVKKDAAYLRHPYSPYSVIRQISLRHHLHNHLQMRHRNHHLRHHNHHRVR